MRQLIKRAYGEEERWREVRRQREGIEFEWVWNEKKENHEGRREIKQTQGHQRYCVCGVGGSSERKKLK